MNTNQFIDSPIIINSDFNKENLDRICELLRKYSDSLSQQLIKDSVLTSTSTLQFKMTRSERLKRFNEIKTHLRTQIKF